MRREWTIAASALPAVLLVAVVAIWWRAGHRLVRVWQIDAPPLFVSSDLKRIARGAHLARTRGCNECPDADLGGKVLIDDPLMGRIVAGNLTAGRGGLLA
ncbi:MAG: hypothetical protein QM661_01945 [Solimonas sp.]